MTTIDLEAIHNAVAAAISSNTSGFNVAAFPLSGTPRPVIEVWPGQPYVPSDDPEVDVNLIIVGFLTTANGETAFLQMADLLSYGSATTNSILDALESDPTLGGVVAEIEWLDVEWAIDRDTQGQRFSIPCRIRIC